MKMQQIEPMPLFSDNQGLLELAKNHKHTKYVERHCHFIKQLVEMNLLSCSTVPETTKVHIFLPSLFVLKNM